MEYEAMYLSPYSWRYGSSEMREIWSEINKRRLWREIWVALAEVQETYTIVSPNQVADLHQHVQEVDVQRSLDIEAVIQHDLMAELEVFASQCPIGGSILHLGATSMDIRRCNPHKIFSFITLEKTLHITSNLN